MEPPEILTVDEAAAYLRIKRSSLQQKIRKGEIPFTPLGEKTVVFVKRFLDLWLALATKGAGAATIRSIELAHVGSAVLPGNLMPLGSTGKQQLAESDRDVKAGRLTKLSD